MLVGYHVEEQKEGRGEDAEMVLIKRVTKAVSTDKAGKIAGMFPLKSDKGNPLPCLKVVLSNGDTTFEVRWSNYYEQKCENPGKFKLVRIDAGKPVMLYETDLETGRKITNRRTGQPIIDFLKMAQEFGSEPIWSEGKNPKLIGWTWGEKQPFVREDEVFFESDSLDEADRLLAEKFGESLATEVMELFVSHELFNEFFEYELAAAA